MVHTNFPFTYIVGVVILDGEIDQINFVETTWRWLWSCGLAIKSIIDLIIVVYISALEIPNRWALFPVYGIQFMSGN